MYDDLGTLKNGMEMNVKNNLGAKIQITDVDIAVFDDKHTLVPNMILDNGEKTCFFSIEIL